MLSLQEDNTEAACTYINNLLDQNDGNVLLMNAAYVSVTPSLN